MDLVFATSNPKKLEEVKAMLNDNFRIISLRDIGFTDDIPEPFPSLEENALQKARVIHQKFNINCFAEDTGLEIEALNGAPGVRSARYAGESKSSKDNIQLVLQQLDGKNNRQAAFRTVAALILDGQEFLFEGKVTGQMLHTCIGSGGFGYDPIFQPDGFTQSFAQMTSEQKASISHRGRAIRKLVDFLQKNK